MATVSVYKESHREKVDVYSFGGQVIREGKPGIDVEIDISFDYGGAEDALDHLDRTFEKARRELTDMLPAVMEPEVDPNQEEMNRLVLVHTADDEDDGWESYDSEAALVDGQWLRLNNEAHERFDVEYAWYVLDVSPDDFVPVSNEETVWINSEDHYHGNGLAEEEAASDGPYFNFMDHESHYGFVQVPAHLVASMGDFALVASASESERFHVGQAISGDDYDRLPLDARFATFPGDHRGEIVKLNEGDFAFHYDGEPYPDMGYDPRTITYLP